MKEAEPVDECCPEVCRFGERLGSRAGRRAPRESNEHRNMGDLAVYGIRRAAHQMVNAQGKHARGGKKEQGNPD